MTTVTKDIFCKEEKYFTANYSPIAAESLGSARFKTDYALRYAYITGSMFKGISSPEMLIALGRTGSMGYLGTGGMRYSNIEAAIHTIKSALPQNQSYGLNLLSSAFSDPNEEEQMVDLCLRHGVRYVEASAYMQVTLNLVRYRLKGLRHGANGHIVTKNHILAKISHPNVAEAFMRPAPEEMVKRLLETNQISRKQAQLSQHVPVSQDICVEADSGGHTSQGVAYILIPSMQRLRDKIARRYSYSTPIRIGAAGGIGTPEAAAAAFILGADFVLTGSINQCTTEAGTSDSVKDLLQDMGVYDTEYAPSGDMFEMGSKVQLLKKGLFFPARANKLYLLYRQFDSLSAIDSKVKETIQKKYFRQSFDEVWKETKSYYLKMKPEVVERAERIPKIKMALIFKWYFVQGNRFAIRGERSRKVDYQVHTGPALGAFNEWVKGTKMESWRNRHVAEIAKKLMLETANILNERLRRVAQ